METFSALLALCERNSPVTGEFPSQRPVTRSFDVFFDLRLNERSSKHVKPNKIFHEFGKERVEIVIDTIGMS